MSQSPARPTMSNGQPATDAALALAAAVEADREEALRQLRYVDDRLPGWTRERRGEAFVIRDQDGREVTDEEHLQRIARLAIPPAYEQVWICPLPNGHIQATGRDAKGRKQYRYHELWQQLRDADKFGRMHDFGLALPRIRRAIAKDIERPGLPREKVLATVIRLLDTTYLRVGNDEYARDNGSFGLTTLRNRHAKVEGRRLRLKFRGKSGVQQQVEVDDPRIARIVRKLQDLPGQELFQWIDDDGEPRSLGSADVNEYLREISGGDFTAKDFRTWHASAMALEHLHPCDAASAREAKARIKEVIGEVARQLGHTLSVCRKSYVHPDVLQHFTEGSLRAVCEAGPRAGTARLRDLKDSERQLLALTGVRGGGDSGTARDAASLLKPARLPASARRPLRTAKAPAESPRAAVSTDDRPAPRTTARKTASRKATTSSGRP